MRTFTITTPEGKQTWEGFNRRMIDAEYVALVDEEGQLDCWALDCPQSIIALRDMFQVTEEVPVTIIGVFNRTSVPQTQFACSEQYQENKLCGCTQSTASSASSVLE